jgi:hypothetical protein
VQYPEPLPLHSVDVMVTIQGITQCIHSIAVPTLCNGNVQGITQCVHSISVPTLLNGNGSGY